MKIPITLLLSSILLTPASFGQWQPVVTGITVTAVHAYSDSLFIGTDDGHVRWSSNMGVTWTDISGNLPGGYLSDIVRGPSGRLFCTDGNGVYRTDDWSTWTLAQDLGANAHCVISYGPTIIACSGPNGGVFVSLDNGITWTNITSGVASQYFTSVAYDGSNIYAGRYGADAIFSNDLGNNWFTIYGLSGENIFSMHYFFGLFAGSYSSIYSPGDPTWSTDGINHQTLDFATSGSRIAACGTDTAIYLSSDHGAIWSRIPASYTNFQINQIAFIDGHLFAGNSDGLNEFDIDTWAGIEEPSAYKLTALYPNPAADQVSIDLPEQGAKPSSLIITDVNGHVVLRERPDQIERTSTLDISGLASGSYQVLIQFPEAIVHRSLVIAR